MRAAEVAGYGVLLTVDRAIPHQQDATGRKLSIVLIRSRTNQIHDLLPFVDTDPAAPKLIRPGQMTDQILARGVGRGRFNCLQMVF